MSREIDSAYVRIWKGYKYISNLSFVNRSGYQLIGISDHIGQEESIEKQVRRRGESDMEHSAKVAYLCSAFISHFPDEIDIGLPCSGEQWSDNVWLLITIALLHDVGEVATGDVPDDGNPFHDTKDQLEREAFEQYMLGAFAREDLLPLKIAYTDFQEHKGLGQFVYMLDKLEALLHLIWLEQYEIYGDINAKPVPTAQDSHYARLTGTPCATDCWIAHSKDLFKDLPPDLTRHAYELLRVAVLDVRGEWFDWWDNV